MKLGLVRHGTTQWNKAGRLQGQLDTDLTEEGRRQAIKLGQSLRGGSWRGIVSSDLRRARETAELIAEYAGIPHLRTDARLREKGFGQLEGTTLSDRLARWGEEWRTLAPGQESDEAVWTRWLDFYNQVISGEYGEHELLVVSHGAFIGRVLQFKGLERSSDPLVNASLTILESAGGLWRTVLYNDVSHLSE